MNFATYIYGMLGALLVVPTTFAAPTLYIATSDADKVVAIDTATDSVVAEITGLEKPHAVTPTPDGKSLIVGTLPKQHLADTSLFVADRQSGHITQTIPVEGWSFHQVITQDSRYILSTKPDEAQVRIIDLQSGQIINAISTGTASNHLLLADDGRFAYVSNEREDTISQIDLKTWRVTQAMPAGRAPGHMVMSPDGKLIFVTSHDTDTVYAVSVDYGAVVDSCRVAKGLHGIDFSDDGKTLFVSSKSEGKLFALDASMKTKNGRKTLKLSPEPYHVTTVNGSGKIYVSSHKEAKLWVVNQSNLELLKEIALPAVGHHMAVVY